MARINIDKLQHIYAYTRGDFGLSGNKNPQQLQKLSDAIESHLIEARTVLFSGHYRGKVANLHYNSLVSNVVVTDEGGSVIAAFRASTVQAGYIMATGRLS